MTPWLSLLDEILFVYESLFYIASTGLSLCSSSLPHEIHQEQVWEFGGKEGESVSKVDWQSKETILTLIGLLECLNSILMHQTSVREE